MLKIEYCCVTYLSIIAKTIILKKLSIAIFVFFCSVNSINAQLFVSKILGKNSSKYTKGWGGFYAISIPVSTADAVSAEIGFNIFFLKADNRYGIITAPLKLGYSYTFDRSGTGFYVEPQLGYNLAGVSPSNDNDSYRYVEDKFNGVSTTVNLGYLMNWRAIGAEIKVGTRAETVFYGRGAVTYAGLMFLLSWKKFRN